ncbi:exodeoxyribonuclease VII small subunit [Clostridium sp. MSJ-8]|uniref:exodeoxyribonuclease VII small subunit n=1 Tax=Clostridium sp. MSJ-8 TaxID=2841510 RepID=UPI001C0F0D16|nr:exodeoxyribonuclease VII small subunit [Clostridium sp. MSJ-8]MBU5487524.1 exodeoxyribonuclease VII small subunit [Clostridium sp. MSJ-8]
MAKKESYEDMMNKLQETLRSLEEDELNLDESIKAYEQGVKLVNKLNKTLGTIEGKIAIVKGNKEVEVEAETED